ncbi:hypothetical protein MP638_004174 [Amoeboaphelidium occidentale]|nr:hypothetical protein MP638_004174 [Amoeboaphelidium occidentale]
MKQKLNTVDLTILAKEFKEKFKDERIVNVYTDAKTVFLKLRNSVLRIDPSVIYTVPVLPQSLTLTHFGTLLRKHLTNKRILSINQLGHDRVLLIRTFKYLLFCEFYASGNIVLCDENGRIVALLRHVDSLGYKIGEIYPAHLLSPLRVVKDISDLDSMVFKKLDTQIRKIGMFPTALIEAVFVRIGTFTEIRLNMSLKEVVKSEQAKAELFLLIEQCQKDVFDLYLSKGNSGFITKQAEYVDFNPFMPILKENETVEKFESFDKAVQEYFHKITTSVALSRLNKQQNTLKKKAENKQNKLVEYDQNAIMDEMKALAIDYNFVAVENAINYVRRLLASGVDWFSIERVINEEKFRVKNNLSDNFVVDIIKECPSRGVIVLTLECNPMASEEDYSDDESSGSEDEESDNDSLSEKVDVEAEIDVGLSVYQNIQRYYDLKKANLDRFEKTKENYRVSAPTSAPAKRKVVRKPFWFEKYNWFISSENYLVISGRDSSQNEQVVKKHLTDSDLYVHASTTGASSVVVKNRSGDVPLQTKCEAGSMAVCFSKAWNAKIITSAYCVQRDQVSKSAPSGEYLSTGSFMIRGKKKYLPPSPLAYGIGILFGISEECISKHAEERTVKLNDNAADGIQEKYNLEEIEDEEYVFVSGSDGKKKKAASNSQGWQQQQQQAKKEADDETDEKPGKQLSRGKRSKMKRAKKKYAGQDEEDMVLRMKLLQPTGKVEEPVKSANEGKDKDNSAETEEESEDGENTELVLPIAAIDSLKEMMGIKDEEANAPDTIEEGENDEETQDDQKQEEEQAEDAKSQEQEEINSQQVVDDEFSVLQSLTGQPQPDDVLLFALPVCAPYSAIENYKYKLKLLPGNLKKGQAGKSAQNILSRLEFKDIASNEQQEATEREKELIRGINETEFVNAILGQVKLQKPDGSLEDEPLTKSKGKGKASNSSSKGSTQKKKK